MAPGLNAEARVTELVEGIQPVAEDFERLAWERLDSLTKPPRSLGRLEEIAAQVACVQRTVRPRVDGKRIVLMAADHGVVAQGVSAFPADVTAQMVGNFAAGGAAVNQLAESVGAELVLVDVGVAAETSSLAGVRQMKLGWGTADIAEGPAMDREVASRALLLGSGLSAEAAAEGIRLLGTGEMGIGNTTAAAALTCAYTGADPSDVAGRGTGLDDAGVEHKARVVERALAANAEQFGDPLGVLAGVGGLEIAGLVGVILGAARVGMCVVVDGFISGAAALAATALAPASRGYILASHLSAERGHRIVLEHLGMKPALDLDMRLGEGTGAALAFGIVDAACRMMSGMATFEEAGVAGEVEPRDAATRGDPIDAPEREPGQ